MTLADFLSQHPWWSLIYITMLVIAVEGFGPLVIVQKRTSKEE